MLPVSMIQELFRWLYSDTNSSHTVIHGLKSTPESSIHGIPDSKRTYRQNDDSSNSGFRSPVLMPLLNPYINLGFDDEATYGDRLGEPCCCDVMRNDVDLIKRSENWETPPTQSITVDEVHKPHQEHNRKDIEQPFIEKGVGDFLEDVIIGRTDHLRKLLAHQTLETVTAATNRAQNNNMGEIVSSPYETSARADAASGSPTSKKASRDRPISSAARSLQAYELVAYIGSGTFSEVTLARHKVTNELYTIKKISKEKVHKAGFVEHTFMERKMLVTLHHPFLVRLYQAFQTRTHLYLVLDFAQGGDLYYFNLEKRWVEEMKHRLKKSRYSCFMAPNVIDLLGRTLNTERHSVLRSSDNHENLRPALKSGNALHFATVDDRIEHISPQTADNHEEMLISLTKVNNEDTRKESAYTTQSLAKKIRSSLSLSIVNPLPNHENCNLASEFIGSNTSTPLLYRHASDDESPPKLIEDEQNREILLRRNDSISAITEPTQETQKGKHLNHHYGIMRDKLPRAPLLGRHSEEHYHHKHYMNHSQHHHSEDCRGALYFNMASEDSDGSYPDHAIRASSFTNDASRVSYACSETSIDSNSVSSSAPAFSGFSPHNQIDSSTYCASKDMEGSTSAMPPLADDASRLPIRYIAFYAIEIALVLQYLHSKGFIYRDLKPENILLRQSGHILLTDFGVAKLRKNSRDDSDITIMSNQPLAEKTGIERTPGSMNQMNPSWNGEFSATSGDNVEERSTSFTGTVEYMSPEMLQGIPHDTRTDWWSYGCLLFEWANGRKPFDGNSQFILFKSIVEENVRVIEDKDFQLTALELHSHAAKLCLRYHELVCEHRLSAFPCAQQNQKPLQHGDSAEHTATAEGEAEGAVPQTSLRQNLHSSLSHSFHSASNSTDKNLRATLWDDIHVETRKRRLRVPGVRKRSVSSTHSIPLTTTPRVCNAFVRYALAELLEANFLLRDLILGLLNRDMGKRLCGSMVLEHPFFACRYVTSQLYDCVHSTRTIPIKKRNQGRLTLDKASEILQGEEQSSSISSSAGPSVISTEAFLECMPVIQRPENWAELFSTMKIRALYVPKLRSRDDLRYFPSAVTATGLRAAVEQHKLIKEARSEMIEHLRQTMRQAVTHSQCNDARMCVQRKKHKELNLNVQGSSQEMPIFDSVRSPTDVNPSVVASLCHNIKLKDINADEDRDEKATVAFSKGKKNIHGVYAPPALPMLLQPAIQGQLLVDDAAQLTESRSNPCSITNFGTIAHEASATVPSSSRCTELPPPSAKIHPRVDHAFRIPKKDLPVVHITATANALEDGKGGLGVGDQCSAAFLHPTMKGTQRGDGNENNGSFNFDTGGIDSAGSFTSGDPFSVPRNMNAKIEENITIEYSSKPLDDSDISKTSIRCLTSEDIFARTAVLPEDFVAAAIVAGHKQMEMNNNSKPQPSESLGSQRNQSFGAGANSAMRLVDKPNEGGRNSAGINHDGSGDYYDSNATEETTPMTGAMRSQEGFAETRALKGYHCVFNSDIWSGEERGAGLQSQSIKSKDVNAVSIETTSLECISDDISGLSTGRHLGGENTYYMEKVHPAEGKDHIGDDVNNRCSCAKQSVVNKVPISIPTRPAVDEVERDQIHSNISNSSSNLSERLPSSVCMNERSSYPSYAVYDYDGNMISGDIHSSPNATDVHAFWADNNHDTFSKSGDHFCNLVNGSLPVLTLNSSRTATHGSLHQLDSNVDPEQGMLHAGESLFNDLCIENPNFEDSPFYNQNEEFLVDGSTYPTWGVIMSRTYADTYPNNVSTLHGIAYDVDDESANSMTICSRTGANPSSPKQTLSFTRTHESTGRSRSIKTLKSFQTEDGSRNDDITPLPFSGLLLPSKLDFSLGNIHAQATKICHPSASPRELWQKRMRQRTTTPSSPVIEDKLPIRKQSVEFLGFTYDGHVLEGGFLGSESTTLTTNFFDDNDDNDSLSAIHTTSTS
ncbi:unnamed protein product [Phytomonas sp. Hart1]|nr:unnamed protein product [Phytomonas sp. Hart1]|eukprot:CCW68860.1 unnamed protein product [Phytomonas sp. isolate Hart1]